jgi:hypothetical protein
MIDVIHEFPLDDDITDFYEVSTIPVNGTDVEIHRCTLFESDLLDISYLELQLRKIENI